MSGFADPSWGCDNVALVLEGTGFIVTALSAVVVDAIGFVSCAFKCVDLFPVNENGVTECNV